MVKYYILKCKTFLERFGMFKTSFSKYIVAFTVIILVSFIMLSGIITSIIGNHLTKDKEDSLHGTAEVISGQREHSGNTNLEVFVNTGIAKGIVLSVLNLKTDFDILISDDTGKVLLTTIGMAEGGDPIIRGELGSIPLDAFFEQEGDRLVYRGDFDGYLPEHSIVMSKEVKNEAGEKCGFVFVLSSTASEDRLITVSRRAVFNSSIWVMLAAVIATYFITERIIHPLRVMKGAAKSFAKGDFRARVTVYGSDEVAELATAFNNMAESLDNLEKMRNSFLASISHDLRTPMTTISGFIDGITSGAIPPERHEYYLGIISAEVHRLSRLVSQILDVSRLESGDRKFNFTDFDIAEVARLVLISFEQKIEDKRLEVDFDAESDEMYVKADKDAIYQVIYNLCHNAIKFSSEGGLFRIKIETLREKKIRFSVYDEGETIAPEELSSVFDRFYKTDKSRGKDKNGVGLGLYIVKTIINMHDGEISASSEQGEYTEFAFEIPFGE